MNSVLAPLLCELSKAERPWQPTKDGAGGVAVRFHPSRVVVNLRAEPTVTDSVDGSRFDVVVFEHDTLHSVISDGR